MEIQSSSLTNDWLSGNFPIRSNFPGRYGFKSRDARNLHLYVQSILFISRTKLLREKEI